MKALTLWQPWATFMALGDKTIETRGAWALRLRSLVGSDLAVHAAARRPTDAERQAGDWTVAWHPQLGESFLDHDHHEQMEELPLGAVVAVVHVLAVVPMVGPGGVVGSCVYVPGEASNGTPDGRGTIGTLWGYHLGTPADGPHGWCELTPELPYGHYEPGRVAVVTDNLRRLADPVPCAGHQQVWNLPIEVEAEVRAALGMAEPDTSGRLW